MTSETTQKAGSFFYGMLKRIARTAPIARRAAARWLKNHDARILKGAGAGLWFNIANTTTSYISGENEIPVQQLLLEKLQPGDVFWDIGANVGFFSVIAARQVGAHGRVFAFEPVPENVAAIRHNAAINHFANIEVVETAVSDHSGRDKLVLASWKGGAALAIGGTPPPDATGILEIELVCVDDLMEQKTVPPPDWIKIDVEGAELNVLKGMEKTLQSHHPKLVYEIDDGNAESYAQKQAQCETLIRSHGYRITKLEDAYPTLDWIIGHFVAE